MYFYAYLFLSAIALKNSSSYGLLSNTEIYTQAQGLSLLKWKGNPRKCSRQFTECELHAEHQL